MQNLNYNNMQFISFNVAGWNWRASNEAWGVRLQRICRFIKSKASNPLVIALQEVQLSGGKYLAVLKEQFTDYHIVLPKAYKNQPRSVVSVLLINKNLCEGCADCRLNGCRTVGRKSAVCMVVKKFHGAKIENLIPLYQWQP